MSDRDVEELAILRLNQMHSYQIQAVLYRNLIREDNEYFDMLQNNKYSNSHDGPKYQCVKYKTWLRLPDQIARPKTETMQYIVLFSHLTVQLPVMIK